MTRSLSGNPGGESSKRPPLGISLASWCPIHLRRESGGGDPRKVTTSDVSLPRTQALVFVLAARRDDSRKTGVACASISAIARASAWASAEARARDRVAATRVRDTSGSRTPPSQQRRSMPSTTALDQSSLELPERGDEKVVCGSSENVATVGKVRFQL